MPLVLEAVHLVDGAPETIAVCRGGGPGQPWRSLALIVRDVGQPPGGYLALLKLVDTAEDVVTGAADNTGKLVLVVVLVVVVLDEDEDCVRDVPQVGPLPRADSAHSGPGHGAPGHRSDPRQTVQEVTDDCWLERFVA